MFGAVSRDMSFSNSSFSQTSASGKSSTSLHKGGFRQVSFLMQYQQSPGLVSQIPLETTPSMPLNPLFNLPVKYTGVTSLSFDGKYMATAYIDNSTNLPVLTIYQGVQNEYSIIYTNTPSDAIPFVVDFDTFNNCTCVISSDATVCVLGYCLDDGQRGAIWTYRNNGTFWEPSSSSKILPIGSVGTNLEFGKSLALSTDKSTLVVGAPLDGFVGDINYIPGAVFVFKQTAPGVYSQFGSKLVGSGASDLAYQGIGVSVSATGSTIAFGAPYDGYTPESLVPVGCGFVFIENSQKTAYIQDGPKLSIENSKTALNGLSCAMNQNGTLVYLGCPLNFPGGSIAEQGVAVFDRSQTWKLETYIPTPRSVVGLDSQFGINISLSLDGNTLVVKAVSDIIENGFLYIEGSFFLFSRSGGGSSPNVYTQNGGKFQNNRFQIIGDSFNSSFLCDASLSGDGKCIAYYNIFPKPITETPDPLISKKILPHTFQNLKKITAKTTEQPPKNRSRPQKFQQLAFVNDDDEIDIIIAI